MGGAVVAVAVAGAGVAGGFVDGVEAGGFKGGVGGHCWGLQQATAVPFQSCRRCVQSDLPFLSLILSGM